MAEQQKVTVRKRDEYDNLPPELVRSVRALAKETARAEVKRLRRDEIFLLIRGMRSQLAELEAELKS